FISSKEFKEHRVTDITEDLEGNLWISSYNYGVYALQPSKFTSYSETEGLGSKIVYSILETKDNGLLIGTLNGAYTFKDGKFTNINFNTLQKFTIRDILIDNVGNTWFCTPSGLIKYKNETTEKYTIDDGLSDNYVRTLCLDHTNKLWIGTKNGLNILENQTLTQLNRKDGLPNDFILSLFEDRSHNIWIGTRDGIAIWDGKNFHSYSVNDGLAGNVIFKTYEDNEGTIWIGCNGGLTRYKNNIFQSITDQNGLASNNVFQILEDDNNTFWITCNDGIFTVSKNELNEYFNNEISNVKCNIYNENDGIKESQCVANSRSIRDKNGRFWFATYNGITSVLPENIGINKNPPITQIEIIQVDSTAYFDDTIIVMQPDKKRLRIKFTGINFRSGSKIHFKYIMEGFDNHPTETTINREAVYTNLPPDEYTFKLYSCNSDGICNEKPVEIRIIKKPHFYETFTFYILVIFGIAGLTGFLFYLRLRREKQRSKELEYQVEQRTATIRSQNKEIKAQANELSIINKELEKLSIVASETYNAVIIADAQGNLEWVNDGFIRMYGYSFDEFIAVKGNNIAKTSVNPQIKKIINNCIENKGSVSYEAPIQTKNGEELWVQTTLNTIVDESGNLKKIIAIDSDI
ncbi:MAG: hypothetical protein C0594_07180, partial [Marinilabiliales bacterium]